MSIENLKILLDMVDHDAGAGLMKQIMDMAGGRDYDVELRSLLSGRLKGVRPEDRVVATVLSAALYGVIPADLYQPSFSGKVDPFFHRLRKAMLKSDALRADLKVNAGKYNFYPEFATAFPNLRERIAAMAKAHAGMDKDSEELVVLFSLGGFFGFQDTKTQMLDALKSAGTTCVMTARGIYAAAGVQMYTEERPPKVNTSSGPQMELGVPTMRPVSTGGSKPVATLKRADQEQYGPKGYNNDVEPDTPSLYPGDIYYVDGDGAHTQLLRPGGVAFAAHVGIVVARRDKILDTVDGGSGMGGRIDLNLNRKMQFVKPIGWTMDKAGSSFKGDDVTAIEADIAKLSTTEAVVSYMRTSEKAKSYQGFIKRYEKLMQDRASVAGDAGKTAIIDKEIARIKTDGHRLMREIFKGGSAAQSRTIQGWWKPEQYRQLEIVTSASVRTWMDRVPNTPFAAPLPREMRI